MMIHAIDNKIEVFFENQKKIILEQIEKAKREILICMAWISDMDYFNALIAAKGKGVKIEIIVSNRTINILNFKNIFDYTRNVCLPHLQSCIKNIVL